MTNVLLVIYLSLLYLVSCKGENIITIPYQIIGNIDTSVNCEDINLSPHFVSHAKPPIFKTTTIGRIHSIRLIKITELCTNPIEPTKQDITISAMLELYNQTANIGAFFIPQKTGKITETKINDIISIYKKDVVTVKDIVPVNTSPNAISNISVIFIIVMVTSLTAIFCVIASVFFVIDFSRPLKPFPSVAGAKLMELAYGEE